MAIGLDVCRLSGTLRREQDQAFAVQVEVGKRERDAEPVVVLGDAAVSHLLEAEDSLEDPERMLRLGPMRDLLRFLARRSSGVLGTFKRKKFKVSQSIAFQRRNGVRLPRR